MPDGDARRSLQRQGETPTNTVKTRKHSGEEERLPLWDQIRRVLLAFAAVSARDHFARALFLTSSSTSRMQEQKSTSVQEVQSGAFDSR